MSDHGHLQNHNIYQTDRIMPLLVDFLIVLHMVVALHAWLCVNHLYLHGVIHLELLDIDRRMSLHLCQLILHPSYLQLKNQCPSPVM